MSDKLDTVEKVLEWAEELFYEATYVPKPDRGAAKRLALAVRVLAIVERGTGSAAHEGQYAGMMASILAEAAQKEGK